MNSPLLWLALVGICLLGEGRASAGEGSARQPGELEMKTSRVVVFKDGHGLFIKEGRAQAAPDGSVFTDQAPLSAILGSFWVTDQKGDIESIAVARRSRERRETKRGACQGVFEIVKANLGKSAQVARREGPPLEGKLLRVLESLPPPEEAPPRSLSPYAASSWAAAEAEEVARPARFATGQYFVLRTSKGDVLVNVADVSLLSTEGMATDCERELVTDEPVNHLTVRFKNPKGGEARALELLYFRPGIRWIPAYRVHLGDGGKAELFLQAEVLNEAEDIEDSPIDFVVGIPTFKFKDTPSPLTLERTLRRALEEVAPQLGGQLVAQQAYMGNVYAQSFSPRERAPRAAPEVDQLAQVEKAMGGSEVQDLFYYSTRRLSLKRGERAAAEIFRAVVSYKHIYTWEVRLPDFGSSYQGSGSPLRTEENRVWHQVLLANSSSLPWTTGPALVLEENRPLGQDMMTFTPPGREVMLPVTAAISVRGTVEESELSRQRHAEKFRGQSYAQVTNRAVFKLHNSLKSQIKLTLTAHIGGKASRASHKGNIVVTGHDPADAVEALNPHSVVVWELEIAPGKDAEVSCQYNYYQGE